MVTPSPLYHCAGCGRRVWYRLDLGDPWRCSACEPWTEDARSVAATPDLVETVPRAARTTTTEAAFMKALQLARNGVLG